MRVHSMRVENYGPFARLEEITFSSLSTIIGRNDAGKSHTLKALQIFFGRNKLEAGDVYDSAGATDQVVVEVSLTALPETLDYEGSPLRLADERLLDAEGRLRVRKTFPCAGPYDRPSLALIAQDFADERFCGLLALKERELNERCASSDVPLIDGKRKLTAAEKRAALRAIAQEQQLPLIERVMPLSARDELWKSIEAQLPRYELFETDTRLGVGETSFQAQFRPIVRAATEEATVVAARDAFTESINRALQTEVDAIFDRLRRHTAAFSGLTVRPAFSWEKAVSFEILGTDEHGVQRSLDQRGSGMRRLLMVAFFQYLAEKTLERDHNVIYAVEEPENCLHPGLQRELVTSFRALADEGAQVILTSHSPVFAGASPLSDLVLIERTGGVARATQGPDPDTVAEELGVEPADQITGYSACVFVEGRDDVFFWRTLAQKLKESGHIRADFDDLRIGLMPSGGHNLKHWITLRAMGRMNRRFAMIVDSDRFSAAHDVLPEKLQWKRECEQQGGACYILHKREIENYLHPDALARAGHRVVAYDDYTDMKQIYGRRVIETITHMTGDEVLAMDAYEDCGAVCHELRDIIEAMLALADTPTTTSHHRRYSDGHRAAGR
ncbi:MAG TPA: AAA family ATPase [Ktedonobacterales bacterium]